MSAGPSNPGSLKQNLKGPDKDLYSSLSWVVRQAYGYVKVPNNAIFAEFKWDGFFRTRVIFDSMFNKKPAGRKWAGSLYLA
jgi:hypothetical protein